MLDSESAMGSPGAAVVSRPSALRGYFEASLYLLLLVGVLSLISTGKLDLVSMLVTPAALLFKGYRWWHGHGPELSNRAANWLVGLYFLFLPVDFWWLSRAISSDAQNPALFSALLATIHLMLFAIVVRLFSTRTLRDCLFLALLAFSAMLASAILTVDTAFLGFFTVFLVLAVSTFVGLEMRRAAEGSIWSPVESGTPAARRMQSALTATSLAVAVCAVLAGSVIFLILPRFRAGYLSGFNLQPQLISGFSDVAELGQIGEIQQSNVVVMRIRVDGNPSLAIDMHWRGAAFTTFDGRRWYTSDRASRAVVEDSTDWIPLRPPGTPPRPRAVPMHYTVMLEPLASDAIFVAADPVQIRGQFTDSTAAGGGIRRSYLLEDPTGSISNPFHNFANVRYDAVSEIPRDMDESLRQAPDSYPNSIREAYLQLPKDLDPRIPDLARRMIANARTPLDRARAIERYLQANYTYTLTQVGPSPADPLAHFFFDTRAGHCEYFASAMTVLLRVVGVPARYVTGFMGGEYNDVGGDYIIRARYAHSWVEAYFPGYGWVTFDPTPPAADAPQDVMTQLSHYWDWFQLQWGDWVVNYDFAHQDVLVQNMRSVSRNWAVQMQRQIDQMRDAGTKRVRNWQVELMSTPPWIAIAVVLLIGLALALRSAAVREWLALRWRLRMSHTSGAPASQHAAVLSYRRMLRLLERRGWRKSPGQTPLEFAAALPGGAVAGPVIHLTRIYQAARFGDQPADAGKLASLLAEVQATLRETRRVRNNAS
jgi:protein-glutamine gamma-glutamyltransferase